MKVKFYLSKKTNAGNNAIRCFVREFNNTLVLNTGEKIKPELWDKKTCRANLRKTKDKVLKGNLNSLNHYLDSFENKIFDIVRSIRSKETGAGFSLIADEIKKQFNKRETTLFTIFDDFLTIKKTKVTKAAIQKFKRVKLLLDEYQKTKRTRLSIENITTKLFLDKFFSFLIEDKNQLNNTAYKNIQFLKTFLSWANTSGFTTNTNYKAFKTKSERNGVIYLTKDEFLILYNLKIDNERLERVRDIFIYQCSTGVRYSDIQNISREDIHGATWNLRTQKTHQLLEIPLNEYALSVLAKYKDYPQPLPVISNQKMNSYLKELCKLAGIDETVKTIKYKGVERIETLHKKYEVIGTHTARRTFISLSLESGMPAAVVMDITGHSTYRMMQKYLKVAYNHKRDEMDKAWGSSLKQVK